MSNKPTPFSNPSKHDFSRENSDSESSSRSGRTFRNRWPLQDEEDDIAEDETDMKSSPAQPTKTQSRPMRFLPNEFDRPETSPRFNFRQSARSLPQNLLSEISISDILLSHTIAEEDREAFYHLELLYMFRQRLRLVALLGLLLLPIFHLFYIYLSPQIAQQTRVTHIMMASVCTSYLFLPAHITSLAWARICTFFGYALMCLGASLIVVILAKNQFEQTSISGLQLAMLAAHSQILISIVLLPLTFWESAVMSVIVAISLTWSSLWTAPFDNGPVSNSQLFVLITTSVFVLCLAHFQTVLRRRAFDATFDLANSVAQMQTLSTHDAVTGGFNRLYLERNLALEINRTTRFARPLSIMMFDLDNFKIVNDTVGHTTGDEVLRIVNQAASLAVRDVDTLARYGGDEFMVVLPETESEDALAIAQRLQEIVRAQLQARFGAQTPAGHVTLSVGIVTLYLSAPITPESIIACADERLYEAKRMGKNCIAV